MRSNSAVEALGRRVIFAERVVAGLLLVLSIAFALICGNTGHAANVSVQQTKDSVSCERDGQTLWQFSFATNKGKPFFHPLSVAGGEPLTTPQPSDHRWHYGLWFSWKYINGVNYWEEDKKTGLAQGATKWDAPKIATHKDGSTMIEMNLRYVSTNGDVVMTEERKINVSTPAEDGAVTIDWTGKFKAGKEPLVLDRTPMMGEPHGAVNGGYAGFSLRAAQTPAKCEFVTIEGPVSNWESDRARPKSKAAACNVTQDGRTDGVAIFSNVSNTGGESPWYMVNSTSMHWFSPALLSPAPKKVNPNEAFTWKFRVVTKKGAWQPDQLQAAAEEYNRQGK